MKTVDRLENNKWVQRLGFWMDDYVVPATMVMTGYVLGLALVVLFLKNATIHPFGISTVETNLATFMASLLVVLVFPVIGYVLAGLALSFGKNAKLTLSETQLLCKQIERCSESISNTDTSTFSGYVNMLLQMVPNGVRQAVAKRTDEYETQDGVTDHKMLYNVIMQEIMRGKFIGQENGK